MMRASGKPAVGHNPALDIALLLEQCGESLPAQSWEAFKQLVAHWMPGGLYDTKYLAR